MLGNINQQAKVILDFIDSESDKILTSEINQLASTINSIETLAEQIQFYFITRNPLYDDESVYGQLLNLTLVTAHYYTVAEVLWNRYNIDNLEVDQDMI